MEKNTAKKIDFSGCPVLIYNESGKKIMDTYVTEHDKKDMTITVFNDLDKHNHGILLRVLIIHTNGVFEYAGRAIGKGTNALGIFKENVRGGRSAPRKEIKVSALIKKLPDPSGTKSFVLPLKAVIENLSSTGILLRAAPGKFEVGSTLEIQATINEKSVILYAIVARIKECDSNTDYYGCKLHFPQ